MHKTIGEKLVELRADRTQQEVAKDIGITQEALSQYERNKRVPIDSVKIKIAKYYNADIANLFFAQ